MSRSLNIFSCLTLAFFIVLVFPAMAQKNDTVMKDGYRKFSYPDGKLSTEGLIREGKPDGYWKSYYENGKMKSEGNRKDFEIDSLWKFFNEDGKLILEINYKKGKKNGIRTSYLDKETIRENYKNDIKDGYTRYYYQDGRIKLEIPFVKGVEQGFGKEYATDGTIITLTEYKKGFIVDRLRINRRDKNNLKQGKWFLFYENGNIKQEGTYLDDKKDGYFKDYTETGDLLKISKYLMGELQPEAEEIAKLKVKNEYYPDGKLKLSAMYRNESPEGIWREFKPDGTIEKSLMYHNGVITGEGNVLDDGNKDGPWKEFFADGTLKSEGNYVDGKPVGDWKYYHLNGKTEQIGKFNKQGIPEGKWKWFYEDGKLLREENYRNGLRDGLLSEYDDEGNLIEEGEFVDGEEDGPWFYLTGNDYVKGTFRDGLRTGVWYTYSLVRNAEKTDSLLMFKGNFIDDLPDGKHIWFWDNGKVHDEGLFVMGKKEGDWIINNSDGTLFLVITFKDGVETRFDGVRIKPPFEREE
ncbi:MAG: toxin-antitoxin system YwqK family antitoxin [Bacteroidetes bacterium]|nr:toxin-antitoxin system YwqK family antitoxin [Bacteroidota bacterium]